MSLFKKTMETLANDGIQAVLLKTSRRFAGRMYRQIIRRPPSEKVENLKNKYSGETVYLIGNGPSLNETPLFLLKGKNVMVFNRFSLMLERLNWVPTLYSVTDDLVLEDMIEEAADMTKKVDYAFFPDISFRGKILFKKFSEDLENLMWLHQTPKLGFSNALPKVYTGGTVIYEGFQILKYLGFAEIVLLGVDMNYKIPDKVRNISKNSSEIESTRDEDPNHFDPRYFGKGKRYHNPEPRVIRAILDSLQYLRDNVVSDDFRVINAGLNSNVDSFERVGFVEHLGYSEEEIDCRFRELIEDFNGGDVQEFETIKTDDEAVTKDLQKFKAEKEIALKLIKSLAGVFIPLGPYKDEYYFIRK